MADESKIEWTDSTFNPWIGCTKVSPACDHCYAEVSTPSRTRQVKWGAGKPRERTSPGNWEQPRRWNARPFYQCGDCGWRGETDSNCPACAGEVHTVRRRVFCASLADWLDNEVPAEWLADLLSLIASTPNLDWLLLTKRIGNWGARLQAAVDCFEHRLLSSRGNNTGYAMARNWLLGEAPSNVWIGETICNQAEADRDVTKLLRVPAAVRFLSVEPMLGRVDLCEQLGMWWNQTMGCWEGTEQQINVAPDGRPRIGWVICGGESGPHARPMHPDWARSLRDQCAAAGVPFLFKQWGEWAPSAHILAGGETAYSAAGTKLYGIGEGRSMARIGKKAAGRLLDGVTHDGYPVVRHG